MTPDERNGGTRLGAASVRLPSGSVKRCHTPAVEAFLLSFAVIFVAELGDKSQLMALTFATRYRAIDVLIGISIATLLVHLGSVALGATIAAACRAKPIAIIGGLAFFVFAAWTLRGDTLDEGEERQAERRPPVR